MTELSNVIRERVNRKLAKDANEIIAEAVKTVRSLRRYRECIESSDQVLQMRSNDLYREKRHRFRLHTTSGKPLDTVLRDVGDETDRHRIRWSNLSRHFRSVQVIILEELKRAKVEEGKVEMISKIFNGDRQAEEAIWEALKGIRTT